MSPRLGVSPPTSFSEFSKGEITSFVETYGQECLDEKLPELDLSVSYRRTVFRATLGVPAGYSGCTVQLFSGLTRAQQNTALFTRDLPSGDPFTSVELLDVARTRPNRDGTPVSVFLFPRASCATGGELAGPVRALKVSSTRPSVLNVRRAKNWMRGLAARLEAN